MVKDILSKIVEDKKQEIIAAKQHIPESFLREKAFAPRKRRPFLKSWNNPGRMESISLLKLNGPPHPKVIFVQT